MLSRRDCGNPPERASRPTPPSWVASQRWNIRKATHPIQKRPRRSNAWIACLNQGKANIRSSSHRKVLWPGDGARIVVVVSDSTSDRYLAGLRAEGIYYLFAGADEIDLGLALDKLGSLGVRRRLLNATPTNTRRQRPLLKSAHTDQIAFEFGQGGEDSEHHAA